MQCATDSTCAALLLRIAPTPSSSPHSTATNRSSNVDAKKGGAEGPQRVIWQSASLSTLRTVSWGQLERPGNDFAFIRVLETLIWIWRMLQNRNKTCSAMSTSSEKSPRMPQVVLRSSFHFIFSYFGSIGVFEGVL